MFKFFYKFFLIFLITVSFLIIFFTYFGVETSRFDALIKSKANDINRFVKLDFNNTKIHLNPLKLNLSVRLQKPKILVKNDKISLSKLDFFIPLKSFLTSDFILQRLEVSFSKNDIKDLIKITNIFIPKILNKKINKIFYKGSLEGKFIIPFAKDGTIDKDYSFEGKISDASINISKELKLKDFTTEINHRILNSGNSFSTKVIKGTLYDLDLSGSEIKLNRSLKINKFKNLLRTKGNLSFEQIKKITKFFSLNLNKFKEINGQIDLSTKIDFNFTKQFKIKNLKYHTEGNLHNVKIEIINKNTIKNYLPDYENKLFLKETKIILSNLENYQSAEFAGLIKVKDYFDKFKIKEHYNSKDKSYNFNGNFDLTKTKIKISNLNYKKDNKSKSKVSFDIKFKPNKYIVIKNLNFVESKTAILFSKLKLNKRFEIDDISKIRIKTYKENNKNNDFSINKSKKTLILGKIFDAQPLLKLIFNNNDQKVFSKKFNSDLKINLEKVLTGTDDDVSSIGMIATISNGSYEKLSLKGNFSESEIVEISIYQVEKDKKTLHVISDRARPFIKNFKFIKGFEGGRLEYESIISKNNSNSSLTINDFNVSKVPALTKLLTLASLQGIADTLSGEGIRFESFEMKTNSKNNLLTIEDALAMGPAISILLEGYVDKGKTVSLRGTLVPATKLNSIIANIPLVGEILVGKKAGEGVVGVSFKIKGSPDNIKTTVNPIKTLTPRFIVRAVEKMKKKKENKSK